MMKFSVILKDFQQLTSLQVAPSHCTGDKATDLFREAWTDNFISLRLGESFQIG